MTRRFLEGLAKKHGLRFEVKEDRNYEGVVFYKAKFRGDDNEVASAEGEAFGQYEYLTKIDGWLAWSESRPDTRSKNNQFNDRLEETGDFWRVCQEVINKGWTFSDLEDAGVIQDLYGFTDTTFEENLIHLKNMLLAPRHRNISAFFEAMREALKDPTLLDSEPGRREWVRDLETALATTGGNDYEIPAHLTKSGNAELYTIRKEWISTPDGEEDYLIVH